MKNLPDELFDFIASHRATNHPIFEHWVLANPTADAVGAFFHHQKLLCDASRPGRRFVEGLEKLGLSEATAALRAIVASEEDHGPHLATMTAFIMNKISKEPMHPDCYDVAAIEKVMAECSNRFFASLPGYDLETASLRQDRHLAEMFARRELTDAESTYRNIGSLAAVELLAAGHVFPGELKCLASSGLYDVDKSDSEMEYLWEHAGEDGAEAWHARRAVESVSPVLNEETKDLIFSGAEDMLEAFADVWDVLDGTLMMPDYSKVKPLRPNLMPFNLPESAADPRAAQQ